MLDRMPTDFGPVLWAAEVRDEADRPLRGHLPGHTSAAHTLAAFGSSIDDVLGGLGKMLDRFEVCS